MTLLEAFEMVYVAISIENTNNPSKILDETLNGLVWSAQQVLSDEDYRTFAEGE